MPENLNLRAPSPVRDDAAAENDNTEGLRLLSRSPHPYHRQNFELLQSDFHNASSSPHHDSDASADMPSLTPLFGKDSSPTSDSGTEADDEHFLKGLPAPKARLRKGIRGMNEPLSGSSTPYMNPLVLEDELREITHRVKRESAEKSKQKWAERVRLLKEVIRRVTEVAILAVLGIIVCSNPEVKPIVLIWRPQMLWQCALVVLLLALYPLRLIRRAYMGNKPSRWIPLAIPVSFDPAPILYPPILTIYVSLLVAVDMPQVVLPNFILSISSIPRALIPTSDSFEMYSPMHWLLSCLPLVFYNSFSAATSVTSSRIDIELPNEVLALLYPMHQSLCFVLHYLTTTSLLPAELQLLSIALIDLLLLAVSPQAQILKALLWVGGLGVLISCGPVIRWGITLARVPKWRFRREPIPTKRPSVLQTVTSLFSLKKVKHDLLGSAAEDSASETGHTSDEDDTHILASKAASIVHQMDLMLDEAENINRSDSVPSLSKTTDGKMHRRSHTLPALGAATRSKTHTPSGRRKRSSSSSVRAFFSLTSTQATLRKWLYAAWVYICILAVILIGVREYIGKVALQGKEPIGWALGYMFGDLPSFRLEVVKANLERWVCLPARSGKANEEHCCCASAEYIFGRCSYAEYLRSTVLGEANTRLILSGYWLCIIFTGLAVVFQLSPVFEVDTRRKVFHFMMVSMFLPTAFFDPAYVALALSLALAVFLLVDLLRASQLPPLSKPIAAFLTPYVDGRDLRGPVVISHIFLLIGCAIPLWLSLAALPRAGEGCLEGWEVPTREVSMVAGIVCVGLGDAAASLIGRRCGHHKWIWGGGKSLEGSIAFAAAVYFGLMHAKQYLDIGGWPGARPVARTAHAIPQLLFPGFMEFWKVLRQDDWTLTGLLKDVWREDWGRTGFCASVASLTEAVLTGGNDNVVVPVVLWTCVKSVAV